jgi:hypothetical protein
VHSGEDAPFTVSGLLQSTAGQFAGWTLLVMLLSFDTGLVKAPIFSPWAVDRRFLVDFDSDHFFTDINTLRAVALIVVTRRPG